MSARRSGDSSPTDGRPSVRKSTTGSRSLGLSRRNASVSAAPMLVPPSAARSSTHSRAASRCRPRAGLQSRACTRTEFEKAIRRNRSSRDNVPSI